MRCWQDRARQDYCSMLHILRSPDTWKLQKTTMWHYTVMQHSYKKQQNCQSITVLHVEIVIDTSTQKHQQVDRVLRTVFRLTSESRSAGIRVHFIDVVPPQSPINALLSLVQEPKIGAKSLLALASIHSRGCCDCRSCTGIVDRQFGVADCPISGKQPEMCSKYDWRIMVLQAIEHSLTPVNVGGAS